MDLNYLLHRQQVERFRAHSAACDEARNAHAQLASLYEQAIGELMKGKIRFFAAHGRTVHKADHPVVVAAEQRFTS